MAFLVSVPGRGLGWALLAFAGSTALLAQTRPSYPLEVARAYPRLDSVLVIGQPRVTIGNEASAGPDLFGKIVGVTMDSERNIYVLDGTEHAVRAFSPRGRFLGSVGRAGRGPGDLREPIAVWHDGRQTLYVTDRYDGVSVFAGKPGDMRFQRRIGAALNPRSACTIGTELFVAAVKYQRVLHVLADDESVKRSFGERFRRDTTPTFESFHDNVDYKVACDEASGRVFISEDAQNLVRGYRADGTLLWQTELPDYSGYRLIREKNPVKTSILFGEFLTRTISTLGQDLLIVQAEHLTHRRDRAAGRGLRATHHGVVSYVLSASTGRVLTRQYGAPFLAMTRSGESAAYSVDPLPQAYLLAARPVP
jgi:hypothetical protein